jgi:hypothetical protein
MTGWLTGLCLMCAVVTGCSSSSSRNEHDALLDEYQRIADRAAELVTAKPTPDAEIVAEMNKLAEKAIDVRHRQLNVSKQATAKQIERYDTISAKFQKALHTVCPTCPKGR